MNEKRSFPLDEGRDPRLMQLFHESERSHDDALVGLVMMRARKLRRRRSIVLLIGCVAVLPVALLLSAPLNDVAQKLRLTRLERRYTLRRRERILRSQFREQREITIPRQQRCDAVRCA